MVDGVVDDCGIEFDLRLSGRGRAVDRRTSLLLVSVCCVVVLDAVAIIGRKSTVKLLAIDFDIVDIIKVQLQQEPG